MGVDSQVSKPPRISKNTASNISFSRGPAKAGGNANSKVGDFDVGLDDIDDAGNIKKVKKKAKTRMLILDHLQEVIKATISEVLVHLLKPEAQDKKKKSLKILSNLVVPQGLDLDLPES